ncbi:MAG: hypothetical protein JG718_11405 [Candidatus Thiothrix moscowensis]|nr:hypothetical protein [Candidatus Thiothrix moscowensis]
MNHTTVAPENQVSRQEALQQALANLHPDDWQPVLDFVSTIKQTQASRTDHTTAEKAYHHQTGLVYDLKEIYALVNVCRLAMQDQGQEDAADSAASVLMLVTNRLFELSEREKTREKALEAIAYPDYKGGADHE